MLSGHNFVARANIKNFERQLEESVDPAQIKTLQELLVLEKAKLTSFRHKL